MWKSNVRLDQRTDGTSVALHRYRALEEIHTPPSRCIDWFNLRSIYP
jgi:hypothetical protein